MSVQGKCSQLLSEDPTERMRLETDISTPFIKTYYFACYGIVILSMSNFVTT